MKVVCLPPAYAKRLSRIRCALENSGVHHGAFKGKRFRSNRSIISIPLGKRWRAVFEITESGYKYRDSMTHEAYNRFIG